MTREELLAKIEAVTGPDRMTTPFHPIVILADDGDPMEVNSAICACREGYGLVDVFVPATGPTALIRLNQLLLLLDAHRIPPGVIAPAGNHWRLRLRPTPLHPAKLTSQNTPAA